MIKKKMFAGASPIIFSRAQELRKQQTFAEEILWNYLRTKPLGFKFRRQHAYLHYILDFYCHKLKLCIEIDGSIHDREDVRINDEERQRQLENTGLEVIRFRNDELIQSPEIVFEKINQILKLRPQIPPPGG